MPQSDVVSALRVALADTFVMYSHAHIAHWNVTGADFHDKHEFLKDLYENLFEAVDNIAERIRIVGDVVPGSIQQIIAPTTLDDAPSMANWTNIRAQLYVDNTKVIMSLNKAFAAAAQMNSQGLCNFLADRLDVHGKFGWMLRASA